MDQGIYESRDIWIKQYMDQGIIGSRRKLVKAYKHIETKTTHRAELTKGLIDLRVEIIKGGRWVGGGDSRRNWVDLI